MFIGKPNPALVDPFLDIFAYLMRVPPINHIQASPSVL
jgi:hypothetical protein